LAVVECGMAGGISANDDAGIFCFKEWRVTEAIRR
jgi:hypothetical protein